MKRSGGGATGEVAGWVRPETRTLNMGGRFFFVGSFSEGVVRRSGLIN